MKKLLVVLLGIFMTVGTVFLSACEKQVAQLSLSQESVSIEIRSDELGSGEAIITADVSGVSEYSLTASANGYDEFLTVSTEKISTSKTNIIIKGVAENDTPSVVTVRVAPGNIEKYIYVDVYSEIKTMVQNTNVQTARDNYLVKGQTSLLNTENLLSIQPAKARKNITWSIFGTYAGASITNNYITIDETFAGDKILLEATASNGVKTLVPIEVKVLDKIDQTVGLKWSHNQNSSFESITPENNSFVIVPNLSSDEKYNGYVVVDYTGDLAISGYAIDKNGNQTQDVVVNRTGDYNGLPLFKISTNQEKTNFNGEYKIAFRIGYEDYNYAFDTMETCPINISVREKVNNIALANSQSLDLEGSLQTLYSSYVESTTATSYGQEYFVSISPTTVIDATKKYNIILTRTQAGGAIAQGCPIEVWYRDEVNGNRWTQVVLTEQANGDYSIFGENYIDAEKIYIKASNTLLEQSVDGMRLILQSMDNTSVSTYVDLRLVKSVAVEDFVFENGGFKIDSSENEGEIVRRKQFTLKGQTSVQGLYIINNSQAVDFGDIQYVSNDESSVTFEVALTLKKSSYGITTLDSYQIAHANGLVSEKMDIDIFLPLKDASVKHNTGENLANSVVDEEYNANTYLLTGEKTSSNAVGISRLMLKNDSTTPISYSFNSINGNYADAKISVGFVDYVENEMLTLEMFKALANNETGVNALLTYAKENVNASNIAYFTNDFSSIITKGVGHTYAVIFFTGKGVENVDDAGNITLARIVLIESFISPNGIEINPEKDKDVTLYSNDSLATSDSELTRKSISISFANSNVTYTEITNIEFSSRNELMGKINISGDKTTGYAVTWANGRYSLSNVVITSDGISFNIEVVGTFGEVAFYDTLDVHYVLRNDDYTKVYDIFAPISITIKNAQRVESLVWKNADDDGLYFEVGDTNPQYIMLESLPASARNSNISFVRTGEKGEFIDRSEKFVSVDDQISNNILSVNLSQNITSGMTGYIYLIPSDAVYNNQIKYYYMDGESEKEGIIADSMLGQYKDSALGITYYDFLTNEAYFKSNASDSEEIKNISFSDIIVKIKINVADGKSFDHAYRIFDNQGFLSIKNDLYYTVMTSLDLSEETYYPINVFNGGIQGANEDVAIRLNGSAFANTISSTGHVQNIKFIGNVSGDGFVASVNEGAINNVTVDTNGIYSSKLQVTGNQGGGGIVAVNYGEISHSSVLGLTIEGENSSVGGIAGFNYGTISYARVEFYNLAVAGVENTYAVNFFKGLTVGGIVGSVMEGSLIEYSYAYNYSTSSDSVLRSGMYVGALAGNALTNAPDTTKIDYSFAVVGVSSALNNADFITLSNYYIAYTDGGNNYKVIYATGYETNPNFLTKGETGFESYVNGENEAHLAGLMQDQRVESVDYNVAKAKDVNGYYKSVNVDLPDGETQSKGIMFLYALKNGGADLTSTETNDLNKLNTISLAQLVGEENVNKNIIITSSNSNVVKVVGNTLKVLKTGTTTLTLASKQDVELNKPIQISVVYALSEMSISWIGRGELVNYVRENSIITIQKTRSRDFMVNYDKTNVYLGTTAKSFDLVQNDLTLKIDKLPNDSSAVDFLTTGENSFKIVAGEDSVKTEISVSPVVYADAKDLVLQSAIKKVFERNFSVQAVDGVISFGVSGQELPITPSSNTVVKVEIKSTDANDSVVPIVALNNETLSISLDEENPNKFLYTLAKDKQNERPILTAVVSHIKTTEDDGIYTRTFSVEFAIAEQYRADVSDNMDFAVHFESTSGNSSKDWNGEFTLSLSRQNFTNIDVQTRRITSSVFKPNANGGYIEVHTADDLTPVLAPGNSAILQININPAFAYFDHVDFSYSFGGEVVLDAVNIEIVEPYGNNSNEFARRTVDGRIESFASSLRYTPTAEEKARGTIYYKVWINTTVERDSRITFTATFYETNGTVISYVNSYLSISYLTQPKITVDGNDTAYVAKGSTAIVQIDVLADQRVDTLSIDGENVVGINIGALPKEPDFDEEKGINTYTVVLSTSVTASTDSNDIFYIHAQVSRELNGNKEYKTAVATVVLVDFKLDENGIKIKGSEDNNVTVWQGVPKALSIEYNLLPENYGVAGDEEAEKAIADLNAKRESFLINEYYPETTQTETANYLINYKYETNSFGDSVPVVQTLQDRLFYCVGNSRVSVFDKPAPEESPVEFVIDEDNNITIVGTKTQGSIEVVLYTYISAGGYTKRIETFFTINADTYSHEDLPLTISNASEFNALNVSGQSNIKQHDYILTNDIVLENYSPFDTKAIKSFDGNGYTIFIKSFNTTPSDTSTLNIGLFRNVVEETILKNVRVNLYNGGQITVDVNKYKTINIAGLAVENNGIITNCEVVSFYTELSAVGQILSQEACVRHSFPTGINVKYVDGKNTSQQVYHDGNSDWTSEIAGFVLTNFGSITNSRVGGDSIIVLGSEKQMTTANGETKPSGYTYASEQALDTFYINGQGNMAGFVLANSGGYIASSFVKNLDMENQSNSTSFYVAGFVGTNTSSILTSYVEGVETDPENLEKDENGKPKKDFARQGSSIKSNLGFIAGFIYSNTGSIKDSYSNILIANSIEANKVYLASGFVYKNEGALENCYSASQIQNSVFTQMNFSGVSADGQLLANGTYTNCYFFNKEYESREEVNDSTTESRYSTGALLIPEPSLSSYFYGFAIADGDSDGIWRMDEEKGITLIEANNISYSHRYIYYVDESNFVGVTAENEQGKYILPYSTLTFMSSSLEIDTSLGGESNPILIENADDWVSVTGLSTSNYISAYFNKNNIWGNYRLVNNIDLSQIATTESSVKLPSSEKAFSGALYGNGFSISGISITSDISDVAFGLFASIEKKDDSYPIVTNVALRVEQVIAGDTAMVGALAGYIKDSKVINVQLIMNNSSSVTGLNFAGALTGLAFGNNIFKNIIVENPTVTADRYSENTGDFFEKEALRTFRKNLQSNLTFNTTTTSQFFASINNLSYAGGVFGFVDNYIVNNAEFDYIQRENYSINNIRATGIVQVQGQVAGGVFGLLGYQTNIRDVGLIVEGNSTENSSYIISTKYASGGIAGQSFGSISRTFAVHEEKVQDAIEDNMSSYYAGNTGVERGILNLFYSKSANYSQKYVGGLVGYAGSGNIEVSYSKLNVTSPTAEYAGGIVGGMDLMNASTYQAEPDLAETSAFTKFIFNEVYATGDVRAKTQAGGIIGMLKGEGSRVEMLAVNAFNYFTTYDYSAETYLQLNEGQTNVSNNFKINSLVGHFVDNDNNIETISSSINEYTKYDSYLTLMKAYDSQQSEEIANETNVPSVAVYEKYNFAGTQVTMNLFDMPGSVSEPNPSLSYLFVDNLVYIVTGPHEFANSSVGHSYTQEGFLNSGSWSHTNWAHDMDDLFPEIKYKRSTDVIYLDCYNIGTVFSQMSGSNSGARVVVRGQTSLGSEEYAHVDIDAYMTKNNITDYPKIEAFKGRLEGGIYKTTESNGQTDVRIIASQNFISSTGVGFYTDGVTVEYTNQETFAGSGVNSTDPIKLGTSGLFVGSEIIDSTISNLTIILDNPVTVSAIAGESRNIGLIAPTIKSTSINNIKIITTEIGTSISPDDSILTVENAGATSTFSVSQNSDETQNKEMNVGLIAGTLSQESTISIMQINDISLKTKSDLIAISETSGVEDYNIGGYFGKTNKKEGTQELRLNIAGIKKETPASGEDDFERFSVTNVSDATNVKVGGYIGFGSGISYIATQDGEKIDSAFRFVVNSDIDNLYVGGMFGHTNSSSSLSINGIGSILQSQLIADNLSSVYAGGFAGKIETGSVKLSEFETINFTATNSQTYTTPNQEEFKETYNENAITVSNTANVGVVVGFASSQFEFKGRSQGTGLNLDKQPIKFVTTTGSISLGSVVGYQEGISGNENANIIETSGKITSKAQFIAEASDANAQVAIGGIVGRMTASSNTGNNYFNMLIGEAQSKIKYDGAIYVNAKKVSAGGVVGLYNNSNATSKIAIENTSFGGAIKLYGQNSDNGALYAGGTVANFATTSTGTTATLKNNYNYGDVFVEYNNSLTKLNNYTFGGILGFAHSNGNFNINNNCTLTTSHNSKYSRVANDTAHAVVGAGYSTETFTMGENYYNHAVVLLIDDQAKDMGYDATAAMGYDTNANTSESLIAKIKAGLDITDTDLYAGHKLRPSGRVAEKLEDEQVYSFNGIRYYTTSGTLNGNLYYGTGAEATNEIKNIAIIGNGSKLTYKSNEGAMIEKLSGHSFISGFTIDADITIEEGEKEKAYGTVVDWLTENAVVYAINVRGKLEVGSKSQGDNPKASGLVGVMNAGKIVDCSTDLDIVYRAGTGGTISGLAYTDGFSDMLIENSYVAGSLKTMINANIYAFASGTATTKIYDCYTIAKIDWNDYTVSDDTAPEITKTINVVGTLSENSNVIYDIDGLNFKLEENTTFNGQKMKYSSLYSKTFGTWKNANNWSTDYKFNYGYPTLKYGYLKTSSYATQNSLQAKAGSSGYDAKVLEGDYTRLDNGKTPSNTDFFLVPNIGVFANMQNISNQSFANSDGDSATGSAGNFALMYDIEMQNRTNDSEPINAIYFGGKLDGRGHTINGLAKNLFEVVDGSKVKGSYIINLRLTNASIDDANCSGILAKTITNSKISNMTLSGSIIIGDSIVGALANTITNSTIECVTNTTKIEVPSSSGVVGGIAGQVDASVLSFCSNYGPLSVVATQDSANVTVGGLVGKVLGTNGKTYINYSYNATSVLSNYATSTSLATTKGMFYAGGLVGTGTNLNIRNSYNSGMIKAGNKSNSTYGSNGQGKAFAGGIIGYGLGIVLIDTCYNEGSVEALGKNPTFAWKWENNDSTGNVLALTLRTTSYRNVFAYGIGYLDGTTNTIQSSHVRMNLGITYTDETIYNNGSSLVENSLLKTWAWDTTIKPEMTQQITGDKQGMYVAKETLLVYDYNKYQFTYDISPKEPKTTDVPFVVITSVNELEIPTSFILRTKLELKLDHQYYHNISYSFLNISGMFDWLVGRGWASEKFDDTSVFKKEVYENYTGQYDDQTATEDYFNLETGGNSFNRIGGGVINTNTANKIDTSANMSIVSGTRSQEDEDVNRTELVIDTTSYYVADKNNSKGIFSAGVYEATGVQTFNKLPYIGNINAYTISATYNGETLGAKISAVEREGDSPKIKYVLYSTNPFVGNVDIKVTADYEETIHFDTSVIKYVYMNDYSVGISIANVNASLISEEYTLTSQSDATVTYDKLIKLCTENPTVQPQDTDNRLTYLGYDQAKGLYVYIPNAKLHNSINDTDIIVNKQISVPNNLTEGSFEQNIKKITDYFGDKTFYGRSVTEETTTKNIAFTDSGFGTISFVGSNQTATQNIELSYGKIVNAPTTTVNYVETKETIVDEETGEETTVVTDRKYQVALSNPTESLIGLYLNQGAISFNNNTSAWGISSMFNTFTMDSITYNISIVDNKFEFRSESITGENNDIKNAITNFFSSMQYIANYYPAYKYTDNFEDVKTGLKQTLLNDAGSLQVKVDVAKEWVVESSPEQATYKTSSDGSLEVSIASSASGNDLSTYVVAGVVVDYGTLATKFSYYQKYTSSMSGYTLTIANDASYFSVEVFEDGVSTAKSERFGDGFGSVSGIMSEQFSGNVVIEGKIYATYKKQGEDCDDANLSIIVDNSRITTGDTKQYIIHSQLYEQVQKDANGNALIDASGNIQRQRSALLTGVSQFVTPNEGGQILVTQKADISSDETGKAFLSVSYSVHNTAILTIQYDSVMPSTIKKIYRYYDENHAKLTSAMTMPEGTIQIDGAEISDANLKNVYFVLMNSEGKEIKYSISRENIDLMTSYFEFGEVYDYTVSGTKYYNIISTKAKYIIENNAGYIIVDPKYKVLDTIEYQPEGYDILSISNTTIETENYVWNAFKMPSYNAQSKTSSFESNWEWLSINSKSGESLDKPYIIIDYNSKQIRIILNSENNSNGFDVVLKLKDEHTKQTFTAYNVDASEYVEPRSIILVKDISFSEGFTAKTAGTNIIGNGYNVSYYGSMYESMQAENGVSSFIRDISLLGESYSKSLVVNQDIAETLLNNVKVYGSVNNIDNRGALIADSSADAETKAVNFKSYVSVDGKSSDGVTLIQIALDKAENHGVITAIRGENGAKGKDGAVGTSASHRNGANGENGTDGKGITASTITGSTLTNYGILKVGKAGNGGAGGTGARGNDRLSDRSVDNTSGEAGTGGIAGLVGQLTGFVDKDSKILSTNSDYLEGQDASNTTKITMTDKSYAGTSGARGRYGFGNITLRNVTDYRILFGSVYTTGYCLEFTYIQETTPPTIEWNGLSPSMFGYGDDHETNVKNVLNGVFEIESNDTFKQKLPAKDVWGNSNSNGNGGR